MVRPAIDWIAIIWSTQRKKLQHVSNLSFATRANYKQHYKSTKDFHSHKGFCLNLLAICSNPSQIPTLNVCICRASKKVPRPKEMPSFPTEHVRDSDLRKQARLSCLGWGVKTSLGSTLQHSACIMLCSKPEFPSPTFRSHCWPNWPSSRRRNQKHFCSTSQKRSWVAHSVNHSSWQHQITWHVKTLPDLPCHHLQLRFPSHRQNLHDKSRHGICTSQVPSMFLALINALLLHSKTTLV